MNKVLLLSVAIFLTCACNSNNKTKIIAIPNTQADTVLQKTPLFIIPLSNQSLICKIENKKVVEVDSFPKSVETKSIVVNNEFICSIDSTIVIYDIKGNFIKEIITNFVPTSLNSKKKVVYFGGKTERYENDNGEIFAMLNLENKDFKLKKIKIPIDVHYGKSIDDILIVNNKMLLVDNIIFPKYLLEYDVSDPKNPKHITTKELENNGTYEHIVKGALNENWLTLLSSTIGMGGSSDHIVIDGKTKGHIAVYRKMSFDRVPNSNKQKEESFNDICLIDNTLYVLIDADLYSLDLNKSISRKEMKKIDVKCKSIVKIIRTPDGGVVVVGEDDKYEKRF